MPLNPHPSLSLCTAFPEITKNSHEKHAYVYEARHTKCPSLPRKKKKKKKAIHSSLWGRRKISYSLLCARATFPYGISFMMHDKPYNSPSPLQHTASNPSCPKVMAVTTGIITHFSFCAAASLYSPPCPHEICLHPAVPEYIYQVHSALFSGWLCWNERPLLDLFTNSACEHTFVPVC